MFFWYFGIWYYYYTGISTGLLPHFAHRFESPANGAQNVKVDLLSAVLNKTFFTSDCCPCSPLHTDVGVTIKLEFDSRNSHLNFAENPSK